MLLQGESPLGVSFHFHKYFQLPTAEFLTTLPRNGIAIVHTVRKWQFSICLLPQFDALVVSDCGASTIVCA